MLTIDLKGMLGLLEKWLERKVTLEEIALGAKLHRKILSAWLNTPDKVTKSDSIDKLVTYFFEQFAGLPQFKGNPKARMDWVVTNLIRVFPEKGEIGEAIMRHPQVKSLPAEQKSAEMMWRLQLIGAGRGIETEDAVRKAIEETKKRRPAKK